MALGFRRWSLRSVGVDHGLVVTVVVGIGDHLVEDKQGGNGYYGIGLMDSRISLTEWVAVLFPDGGPKGNDSVL